MFAEPILGLTNDRVRVWLTLIVTNTGEVQAIELSRDQAGVLYEELSIVTHVQLGLWGGH
jgi:hypothetical protein